MFLCYGGDFVESQFCRKIADLSGKTRVVKANAFIGLLYEFENERTGLLRLGCLPTHLRIIGLAFPFTY